MRISDWSSDVCSSDLSPSGHEELCPESASPLWRCVSMTDRNQSYRPVCRPPGTGRSICPAPFRRSPPAARSEDRKGVVSGKSVSVRVDLGGRRIITKKPSTTYYYSLSNQLYTN